MELNFEGILIGIASLLIIGLFHPIVIKCEYYFPSASGRSFSSRDYCCLPPLFLCRVFFPFSLP